MCSLDFAKPLLLDMPEFNKNHYRKISYIRRTLVGNKIVDHSDVGAAPTTFPSLT